jgi:polar amino acid transport system permease protein
MTLLTGPQLQFLLQGLCWTAVLSLMAFVGGGLLGFVVAILRVYGPAVTRNLTMLYIKLIQGTPLLVLLSLAYFGLPTMGLNIEPLSAAGLGLSVYVSAYLGEIWRGCIESVPRTQAEAAECLALNWGQRLIHVILPQAMRIATPPTVGFMVQIVKNTSLASAIGFVELARAGQVINNATFQPFVTFMLIAALYFALCYPLSVWSRRLERKLNVANRYGRVGLEEFWRQSRAGRRLLHCQQGVSGRHHRTQRLRQEHGAALHRPPGVGRCRSYRGLRARHHVAKAEPAPVAPRCRHRVPEL